MVLPVGGRKPGIPDRTDFELNTLVNQQSSIISMLAYNTYDPADPQYGAVRGVVSSAQRTANRAAIQAAADDARDNGGLLVIKGEYDIDGTVEFQCHVDGTTGTLNVYDETIDPVVRVGTTESGVWLSDLYVILPNVVQTLKVGYGWTGSDCGVEIANLNGCNITTRRIQGFVTNLRLVAHGTGCVYNTFDVGWLSQGKVNLHLAKSLSTDNGWVQENLFVGGRYSHRNGEGTEVPGTRHILIDAQVSNHLFLKPSVEGDVPEYHVECGGSYNQFVHGRWEASPPRVRFHTGTSNFINHGWGAENIQFTIDGAAYTHVHSRNGWRVNGSGSGTFTGYGGGNASGVFVVVPSSTADPATDYLFSVSPNFTTFKNTGNTQARLRINNANGTMQWGDGSNEPDVSLSRSGNNRLTLAEGDYFRTGLANPLPTASSAYRGYLARTEGGEGVADGLYVCLKGSDGNYSWVQIA